MPEYAFDVKLASVVRIKADNEKEAREAVKKIDCLDYGKALPEGIEITEFSAYIDDCAGPWLFEVDGVNVEIADEDEDG